MLRHGLALTTLIFALPAFGQEVFGQEVAPWATYRGNAQRTGHTDGMPGPSSPKLLWVVKSKEHYIASPVPAGNRLFLSGLGAFNAPHFGCLNIDPKAAQRTAWMKTTPYLRQATVSSPAVVGNKLIFGDGMHQTDGAILHCVEIETGAPIWELPVPGKLVHLEGSPAVIGSRAYIGGGAAGVLCIDHETLTLAGKEVDLAEVKKIRAQKWKELQAAYDIEKKKNEFAQPPTEEQLPVAQPKTLWQAGKEKWHVDSPVTVAGDKVLVASAFLDKEMEGDKALFCLDAKTGNVLWRAPLKLNPWGGPSLAGDTVIVTGSSIGYDTQAISKKTKGFIAAYNLADGKEKWFKDIPGGGVVACAALSSGAAVVSATDGKVRAFEIATGERRWIYETKFPCFAPVAIAGDTVYAGDLKGVVHAIGLKSGTAQWTLDLGTAKEVGTPGMVYGGLVVQGGRLFVTTCNLEGPNAREATVVVCIGEK